MALRLYVNYALLAAFFALFTATAIVIDRYRAEILSNLERASAAQDTFEEQLAENETMRQFADIYLPPEMRANVRGILEDRTIDSIMQLAFWASISGALAVVYMVTFGLAPMRRECQKL